MDSWDNPTQGSPQVYLTTNDPACYLHQPDSQYDGPIGLKGNQSPRTGEGMVGLWCFTIDGLNQRQYVQAELSTPMMVGQTYFVQFYVSLGDNMEFGCNNIGASLTTTVPGFWTDSPLGGTPQIVSTEPILETDGWVEISGFIEADQPYAFVTIGNFQNDQETTTAPNPSSTGEPGTYGAFYFVDDVTVEPDESQSVEDESIIPFQAFLTSENNLRTICPTNGTISIHDLKGNCLLNKANTGKTENYNISHLAKGTYLVSFAARTDKFTVRIVK